MNRHKNNIKLESENPEMIIYVNECGVVNEQQWKSKADEQIMHDNGRLDEKNG